MHKRDLIREFSKVHFPETEYDRLSAMYGIETFSKSCVISNIADLFTSLDKLVELGRDRYLEWITDDYNRCEGVINDSLHLRNLFLISDEDYEKILKDERTAYVRRQDIKIEIQFIETNERYVESLINISKKVNRFTDKKNSREYRIRELDYMKK